MILWYLFTPLQVCIVLGFVFIVLLGKQPYHIHLTNHGFAVDEPNYKPIPGNFFKRLNKCKKG